MTESPSKARARARGLRKKGDLEAARRVLEAALEAATGIERATVEADLEEIRRDTEALVTREIDARASEPGATREPAATPESPASASEPASPPAPRSSKSARPPLPDVDGIAGSSAAIRRLREAIATAAAASVPVLIEGESGTGKELVARAIHRRSQRAAGPFVAVAPATLAPGVVEDELFGHVAGAFTGADRAREGLLAEAKGGTVLLDGVDEISLDTQAKLLRALEAGEVRPIGGGEAVKLDVRIIATTRRSLGSLAREGSFRDDLLYRLSVLRVSVPPLRERADDLPALVAALLERHRGSKPAPGVTAAVLERLAAHPWPGNVRELENELRRWLVVGADPIDLPHVAPAIREGRATPTDLSTGLYERLRGKSLEDIERSAILAALRASDGNRSEAARLLKVSRRALYDKLKRLGIDSK